MKVVLREEKRCNLRLFVFTCFQVVVVRVLLGLPLGLPLLHEFVTRCFERVIIGAS